MCLQSSQYVFFRRGGLKYLIFINANLYVKRRFRKKRFAHSGTLEKKVCTIYTIKMLFSHHRTPEVLYSNHLLGYKYCS